jgi:CheY-like chemotaxis protein/two-component sensor histidine kinase
VAIQSEKKEPKSGPSRDDGHAGALHEVSNALTVALGWLQIAQRKDDSASVQKALAIAEEHARRGHQIARKAIGAEVQLEPEQRRAGELARFVAESIQPQADEKQVRVMLEPADDVDVAVEAAPTLTQILTNLLLNALAFAPVSSTVTLKVVIDENGLCFSVSDQGPGIPLDRLPHLFSDPHSTRVGGAGIGLPHSRVLARSNGGDLRVVPAESGALFEVTWPLAGRETRTESSSQRRLQISGARILVVDDDAALTALVEMGLEARGAEVIVASSQEQLKVILEGRPVLDAVLLDLSPVEANLEAVLAELKNKLPAHCALLLMSGQPGGVPEAAGDCFCDWVRKPFEVGELVQAVSRQLRPQ